MVLNTLQDLFENRFARHTAVIIPPTPEGAPELRLSYPELGSQLQKVGQTLVCDAGVRPGDAVATYFPNGLPMVATFLGTTFVRAVSCPLNPAYKKADLLFYMQDTKPKVLIVPPAHEWDSKDARLAAQELRIPVWECSLDREARQIRLRPVSTSSSRRTNAKVERAQPDDICLILHTSGTTSRPKAVPLRHRNLVASLANIRATYRLSPDDVALLVMPSFHVHGLIGVLLSTLSSGGTVVIPPKFSASAFWPTFAKYNCSWFSAVPTIHQMLLRNLDKHYRRLSPSEASRIRSRHRFSRSCSAALPAAVMKQLEEAFGVPILEAYAMTEASHQMCANPLPPLQHKAGSVGMGTGVDIAILNDNNEILPQGEIGEISIRAPNVTSGYLNNPEANKKCFCHVKEKNATYFRTGDQGFKDPEDYVFLTGRLKEMINRGGEKIAPLELDDILISHPEVNTAVVFGVPDDLYGEEVWAAVVPKGKVVGTLESVLKDFMASKVPGFKQPKRIFITDDVPRTATGKIQRRIVSAHFQKLSDTLLKSKL